MDNNKKFELDDEALDNVAGGYYTDFLKRSTERNGITFTTGDTVTLPGSYCGCGQNGNSTTGLLMSFREDETQIKTHCCGKIVYCDFSQVTK